MFQPEALDMETAFMKLTEGRTAGRHGASAPSFLPSLLAKELIELAALPRTYVLRSSMRSSFSRSSRSRSTASSP